MDTKIDLKALDKLLSEQSYTAGEKPTQDDFTKWAAIKVCPKEVHVSRWWNHIAALKRLYPYRKYDAPEKEKKDNKKDQASLDHTLVNAVHGKVVTRFPPEPSGYLHIGHAKAALLNATYAEMYGGKCLLRFDDTNPSKEKAEYQESIVEDLKLLEIKHEPATFTSDYIGELEKDMEKLIRAGKAYADDTDAEQMKTERDAGIASKHRDNSVEENITCWKEMLKGSEKGLTYCVRGKIDMQCDNKCMRDPVFFRCKVDVPHHRHGTKHKAYPTYDFCCAIVDAREGVSHALRSLEYCERKEMYHWVLENTGCRKVELTEFSRMSFNNTVLSKRKLTKLVDDGVVTGWDDPRMPTVRGIIRRGMTVAALKEFVMTIGSSRNNNSMEWDKIWAINKQKIDPIIPRYCGIVTGTMVEFTLSDGPAQPELKKENLHPKDPSMGTKDMYKTKKVYLRKDDAEVLANGEEITLMHWGNVFVDEITKKGDEVVSLTGHLHLEGNPKTTKYKLNWLPVMDTLIDVTLRELGHLFTAPTFPDDEWMNYLNPKSLVDTPAKGEPAMLNLKKGDRLQLERGAYYIVDQEKPLVLVEIPDGRSKKVSGETRKDVPATKDKAAKGAKDEESKKSKEAVPQSNGVGNAPAPKGKAKAKEIPKKGGKPSDRPLDDISRLNIVVAKITKVWPHPDADKLWCEEIDIGRDEPLKVCTGLRAHFTQEQMQDRRVVVIANMKPVKMRGVESQGMVMCAVDGEKFEILVPPENAKVGERICLDGYDGEPDEVLNNKPGKAPVEAVKENLKTNDNCEATYKGAVWKVGGGVVSVPSNKNAPIS